MPIPLPLSIRTLLQRRSYGHVVTYRADGSPHLTMVWVDGEGDEVLFNTAAGRVKERNLRRDPRILVSVQDPDDPQLYALMAGHATITTDGAEEHNGRLWKRFLDRDDWPRTPGEQRVIVRIAVDRLSGDGPHDGSWLSEADRRERSD